MPTAKVTKNVSAAIGGGNVLCSTLISIKTKAWLYSFHPFFIVSVVRSSTAYTFSCSISWSDCTPGSACDSFFCYLIDDILLCLR